MNRLTKVAVAATAALISAQALAEVTFYGRDDFQGPSFSTSTPVRNLERFGFNERASSVVVNSDRWEVCEGAGFTGRCVVLRPGTYSSLSALGLNDRITSVRLAEETARVEPAPPPAATNDGPKITFYGRENFQGPSFTASRSIGDLERFGFNDRASSVVVVSDRWQVCEGTQFSGRCFILRPGSYPTLADVGMSNRITSVRLVDRAPEPVATSPAPEIIFYGRPNFQGRSFTANRQIGNLERLGFNDRASSIVVVRDRWEVCEGARFDGKCVILGPGNYPSLSALGLNDDISSARVIDRDERFSYR